MHTLHRTLPVTRDSLEERRDILPVQLDSFSDAIFSMTCTRARTRTGPGSDIGIRIEPRRAASSPRDQYKQPPAEYRVLVSLATSLPSLSAILCGAGATAVRSESAGCCRRPWSRKTSKSVGRCGREGSQSVSAWRRKTSDSTSVLEREPIRSRATYVEVSQSRS